MKTLTTLECLRLLTGLPVNDLTEMAKVKVVLRIWLTSHPDFVEGSVVAISWKEEPDCVKIRLAPLGSSAYSAEKTIWRTGVQEDWLVFVDQQCRADTKASAQFTF